MLVVKVFGGLGNQMFQYLFYQYLKMNNEDVYLDLSDFKIHRHHNGYELGFAFGILPEEKKNKNIKKCCKLNNSIVSRTIAKFGFTLTRTTEFKEWNFISQVKPDKIYDDIYFNGYWQDKYYLEQVGIDRVRELLTFQVPSKRENEKFIKMAKERNIVSVHIRRGDYLSHDKLQNICTESYYNNAIAYIKKHICKPVFAFFSDDVEWCRSKFGAIENAIFVDWNKNQYSYCDMYLISLCKGNIIANSTFSLWAAYLNKNKNAIVIAPEKWKGNMPSDKLILSNWVLINSKGKLVNNDVLREK